MNVLNLIPAEYARSDAYWVGTFAMAIACALSAPDSQDARRIIKPSLDDFMRSPACDPEVKRMLKKELAQ